MLTRGSCTRIRVKRDRHGNSMKSNAVSWAKMVIAILFLAIIIVPTATYSEENTLQSLPQILAKLATPKSDAAVLQEFGASLVTNNPDLKGKSSVEKAKYAYVQYLKVLSKSDAGVSNDVFGRLHDRFTRETDTRTEFTCGAHARNLNDIFVCMGIDQKSLGLIQCSITSYNPLNPNTDHGVIVLKEEDGKKYTFDPWAHATDRDSWSPFDDLYGDGEKSPYNGMDIAVWGDMQTKMGYSDFIAQQAGDVTGVSSSEVTFRSAKDAVEAIWKQDASSGTFEFVPEVKAIKSGDSYSYDLYFRIVDPEPDHLKNYDYYWRMVSPSKYIGPVSGQFLNSDQTHVTAGSYIGGDQGTPVAKCYKIRRDCKGPTWIDDEIKGMGEAGALPCKPVNTVKTKPIIFSP